MKIATRRLLPLELFLSIVMASWGLSGWLGGGQLWKTLHQFGLNAEFGLVLCGTALAQLCVCALEASIGRRWAACKLLASVRARYWLAFLSLAIWVYVLYVITTLRGSGVVVPLMVQAPAAILFLAYVYVENLRTAHVLDPQVPTQRLQRQILADRLADRDEALGGR